MDQGDGFNLDNLLTLIEVLFAINFALQFDWICSVIEKKAQKVCHSIDKLSKELGILGIDTNPNAGAFTAHYKTGMDHNRTIRKWSIVACDSLQSRVRILSRIPIGILFLLLCIISSQDDFLVSYVKDYSLTGVDLVGILCLIGLPLPIYVFLINTFGIDGFFNNRIFLKLYTAGLESLSKAMSEANSWHKHTRKHVDNMKIVEEEQKKN